MRARHVLFLWPLVFFELLYAHSIVLLLPPVLDLFSHTDMSDCINQRRALPYQNFDLQWLHNNLFGLVSLNEHLWSSAFLTIETSRF